MIDETNFSISPGSLAMPIGGAALDLVKAKKTSGSALSPQTPTVCLEAKFNIESDKIALFKIFGKMTKII